jgi:hypothetical protein
MVVENEPGARQCGVNLDITVDPSEPFAAGAQVSMLSRVDVFPLTHETRYAAQWVDDETHDTINSPEVLLVTGLCYRVLCDLLPRNSALDYFRRGQREHANYRR